MEYSNKTKKIILSLQKDELFSYHIYNSLANQINNQENAEILRKIAKEELKHYTIFKGYSGQDVPYSKLKVKIFTFLARILGLIFSLRWMETKEASLDDYEEIKIEIPEIQKVIDDEEKHELQLIDMIDEEQLSYMSSVVLGLNDALVELTGALAGFTLSIQNSKTIAFLGLITGISASFSMAASEYLSTKAEDDNDVNPKKAALYTGVAYVFTVMALILPYFFISNYIISLIVTIIIAIIIIAIFNYYLAIAKGDDFKTRFFEMALISISVASISFIIGFIVKKYFGLEI